MAAKSRDPRENARRNGGRRERAPPPSLRASGSRNPGLIEEALAVFAHEVRTPLTGILAISDLLATSELADASGAGSTPSRPAPSIWQALRPCSSMPRRTATAAARCREDLFDLRALARSAGDSLAGRAAAKGLQAEVAISEQLPSLVVGDPIRLRAALENLIDNAVKFTEAGRVALQAAPARARQGRIGVAFAVSDSGIGVSLQEIKRLFRPFSQANVWIASRFGGAGLGLSSVKQIARGMGGDIKVVPRRGGGTTFTLTVTLASASGTQAEGADEALTAVAIPPLRILGVEDNPFGRVVLNTILSELGHQAEFIGRGEAAAERIAQGGVRRRADGHGAAGHRRHRGDQAHPRA